MKKKAIKWTSLLLVLMVAMSVFLTACDPKKPGGTTSSTAKSPGVSKTGSQMTTTGPGGSGTTETAPKTTKTPESTPPESEKGETKVFTDSAGRKVTVPTKITRIAPSGPLAQIVLYTACPDLLCGVARPFSKAQLQLIDKKYDKLPAFGQFYGRSSDFNLEAVLKANTEVIIDIGEAKKTIKEDMDNMQKQINVPTIFIEATFAGMAKAYRDLGELIGDTSRTEKLAKFCEETMALSREATEKIAEDKRVSIYWAMGENGLNTNAVGSFHAELLDYIPVKNVVNIESSSKGGGTEVSMEQILQWKPDYILVSRTKLLEAMKKDAAWKGVAAMKDGKHILIPSVPYGFMGGPPSVNRYLGVRWLGATFYPEVYKNSPAKEVREFFDLFYNITVTDDQLNAILDGSFGKDK